MKFSNFIFRLQSGFGWDFRPINYVNTKYRKGKQRPMAPCKRGGAYMKLHLTGTANRLNVEHRTSNFERPILMALRLIYIETSEPKNIELQNFEGNIHFIWNFEF